MRHLILYTPWNSEGKRDGDEFTAEALAYSRFHRERGDECVIIQNPQVPALQRPAKVEERIMQAFEESQELFDVFAFFGHGTEGWIQTGHTLRKTIGSLASTLGKVLAGNPMLWVAACKTGKDKEKDGVDNFGFLHRLIYELHMAPLQHLAHGWGHLTAGHTSRNPHLICFQGPFRSETADNEDFKILKKALWAPNSTLRFEIALCRSFDELHARNEAKVPT
jgi:hypothetical protein